MDYPYDLGRYARTVTTASPPAQIWFDRGLNWCFGYHHYEAVACFEKALEADPHCAMAQWGIGYAAGPNYNFPWEWMDPASKAASLARSYDAAHAALSVWRLTSRPASTGALDEEAGSTRPGDEAPADDE